MIKTLKEYFPLIILASAIVLLSIPQITPTSKYIDNNDETIQKIILEIEQTSTNDLQKIVKTADYLKENMKYELRGEACLEETAADVAKNGYGDCVSGSKLAVAILTGLDIPVQIVEGCISNNDDASRNGLRTFTLEKNPLSNNNYKGGVLHNWVRAYDGNNWQSIETTAGKIFPTEKEILYGYQTYGGLVDQNDPEDLCLLLDQDFVNFCKQQY